MTYALLALVFLLCLALVLQTWFLTNSARAERRELEDRLMAVSQPVALIQHKAHENNSPAEITYVGENADDDD